MELATRVSIAVHEGCPPVKRRLERVLPTANVDVIINLAEDELRTYGEDGSVRRHAGAVLSGPASASRVIDSDETTNLITVSFPHGTAGSFLGYPLHELTDSLVPLDDIFGPAGAGLRTRLLDAPSKTAKVAVVEAMLRQVRPARDGEPVVRSALAALDRGDAVHSVSRALDVSPRHLGRLFLTHVGMTPKRYARIRRLQRVLRAVENTPEAEWSAVAADHHYADQSHLIRDFRDLAGLTPTNYRALVTGAPNHVAFVQSSDLRAS